MKVEADVIEVLMGVETDGNRLRITQKLDRTMYQKVNKTLSGLGGKWNSREKAHVFEKDVSEIISQIVETGEYKDMKADCEKAVEEQKQKMQQVLSDYARQNDIVHKLIDLALLQNGMLKGEALDKFLKRSVDLIK